MKKVLLVVAALSAAVDVLAADGTWSGGGTDGKWSTTGNWESGNVASKGTATFKNAMATEVVLDKDYTIYKVAVDAAATSPLTIAGTATLTLTMGHRSDLAVYINKATSAGTETSFKCPVVCSRAQCQYSNAGCAFYDNLTITASTEYDFRIFRNSADTPADSFALVGPDCSAALYGPTSIRLNYNDTANAGVRLTVSEGAQAVLSPVECGLGSSFEVSGADTLVVVTNAADGTLGALTALKTASSVKLSSGALTAKSVEVGAAGGRLLMSGGTLAAESVVCSSSDQAPSQVSGGTLKVADFNTTGSSSVAVSGAVTFDLSDADALLMLGNVTFDSAAVTVALGDRAVELGTRLVAWEAIPEGVTFLLTGTQVGEVQAQARASGLYFGKSSNEAATAAWTGAAGDGDVCNIANWACTNEAGVAIETDPVLTAETALSFAGRLSFDCPKGTAFDHGPITFGDCALTADCDWAGLFGGVTASGLVFDLAGHKLTVSEGLLTTGTCLVTNSTGVAEFHFDVAENAIFSNTVYRLAGDLRFFKEGAGEFWLVAENAVQDHTGGTEVRGGVCGLPYAVMDTIRPFGTDCGVDIYTNGLLNINGSCNWGSSSGTYAKTDAYTYRLRGGTLESSHELPTTRVLKSKIVLLCDSSLVFGKMLYYEGEFTLNGHTLALTVSDGASNRATYWRAKSTEGDTGALQLVGGNYFRVNKEIPAMSGVDLLVRDNGSALYIEEGMELSVHDYYADYHENNVGGSGLLKVFGTFTPAVRFFYGCTMQDASVIDLSAKTAAWSIKSANTGTIQKVGFADGAHVTIALGEREIAIGDKLIDWTDLAPSNLSSVHFLLEPGFRAAHPMLKLRKEADGVYVTEKGGVVLIVR